MYKLLVILACIPITPIVLGSAALYRHIARRRQRDVVAPQIIAATE